MLELDGEMEGLQSVILALQQQLQQATINGGSLSTAGEDAIMSDADSAATAPPTEPGFVDSPGYGAVSQPLTVSAPQPPVQRVLPAVPHLAVQYDTVTPPPPMMDGQSHALPVREHAMADVSRLESFDPIPHSQLAAAAVHAADAWPSSRAFGSGANSRTSTPELSAGSGSLMAGQLRANRLMESNFEAISASNTPPCATDNSGAQQQGPEIISVTPPPAGSLRTLGEPSGAAATGISNCSFMPISAMAVVTSSGISKCRTPTPPAPGDADKGDGLSQAENTRMANGPHMEVSETLAVSGAAGGPPAVPTTAYFSTMDVVPVPSWKQYAGAANSFDRTLGEDQHPAVPVSNHAHAAVPDVHQPSASSLLPTTSTDDSTPPTAPFPSGRSVASPSTHDFAGSNGDRPSRDTEVAADPEPSRSDLSPDRKRRRRNVPSTTAPPELADPFNSKYTSAVMGGRLSASARTTRRNAAVLHDHARTTRGGAEHVHVNGGPTPPPVGSDDSAATSSGTEDPFPPTGVTNGQGAPPPPAPVPSKASYHQFLDAEED